MNTLSLALQLILSLSILVVLHELGHYLPAKWFKTRVEKFYLFFDPYFSLVKKKIGDTEWGIGWIPFGGYVKISGMIDESMDKDQMKLPPQPWEFRSKKAWQRLIIMLGGVTVNFILGIVILAGMLMYYGESYIKTSDVKYGIVVDSMGTKIGLQDGDIPLKVGNKTLDKFGPQLVSKEIIINEAKEITVERDGKEVVLSIPSTLASEMTKYENKSKQLYALRLPFVLIDVDSTMNAYKYGLRKNMKIVKANDNEVIYQHDFLNAIRESRNGIVKLTIENEKGNLLNKYIGVSHQGKIGVAVQNLADIIPYSTVKYGFFESISKGTTKAIAFLSDQLKAFGQIFTGKMKAKDTLGSVFSMATLFDSSWDWQIFWQMTASLSILLAFFNLLPIPALDGGYVVFLLWEVITGKVPSDKFMEVVNYVGFILLMLLMVFAIGLDVSRFFG